MLDLFLRGGWVMWPILFGSIVAVAITLERLYMLRKERIVPTGFYGRIEKLVNDGRIEHALAACRENTSALAQVLAAALRNVGNPRELMREAVEMAGRAEVANMQRYVSTLSIISQVETLMGLFGTVLGLIEAFRQIEATETMGSPAVVAAGVWVALLTTAAGLLVAIPAFLAYHYFFGRVRRLTLAMEERAFHIVGILEASAAQGLLAPSPNGASPAVATLSVTGSLGNSATNSGITASINNQPNASNAGAASRTDDDTP